MKTKIPIPFFLISLIIAIAILVVAPSLWGQSSFINNPPKKLINGWLYRWGDLPLSKDGKLSAIEADGDTLWNELGADEVLKTSKRSDFIWYRTKLPDIEWTNPAIFIPPVILACQVYLDGDLIYSSGTMLPANTNKFSGLSSHIIPLDGIYRNKVLAIRIFSNRSEIGIDITSHHIMVGNEGDLYTAIIRNNIDSIIIGFIFVFIGLFSIFIFLKRFEQKIYLILTFGLFSFCVGLFYISFDHTGRLFIEPPALRYYFGFFSYLLFPVALYAFIEELVGKNIVIRRIWQIHLSYAFVALLLDLLNIVFIPEQRFYYSLFFVGTILITLYVTIREAFAGNNEVRIFIAAFAIFALTGLHDILVGINVIPQWYWLSQWGALVFVLSLGYIVERRFADTHKQLRHYSHELELKSRKLDKYSQILEQKVAERTEDLNTKNQELEKTLSQLKKMQHQLIMQEKMASLGNLVAGVAHEVNNPIGAVKSSAHVLNRCIDKIHSSLTNSKSIEEIRNDDRFQKALSLLQENNQVISTASNRVSEIVLSLKNFARLDEADLQKADIHEGIDTTLTLVDHELKNRVEVIREYGNIPKINCYPNQLNQVFMNMFVNAAHAIKDKGFLKIKTSSKNEHVQIEVSDNGRGISAVHLEKIFDPGFTTKGRGIGTGLGLSISYNIVKKHNGDIKVESEVEKGTTFTIVLPVNFELTNNQQNEDGQ